MFIYLFLLFILTSYKCLLSNQFAVRRELLSGRSRLVYINLYYIRVISDIALNNIILGLYRGLINYYFRVKTERLNINFLFKEYF
jgi:hypothetical protein